MGKEYLIASTLSGGGNTLSFTAMGEILSEDGDKITLQRPVIFASSIVMAQNGAQMNEHIYDSPFFPFKTMDTLEIFKSHFAVTRKISEDTNSNDTALMSYQEALIIRAGLAKPSPRLVK